MKLKKFNDFKGYPTLDLNYSKPAYKTDPKEQKEFIKNNIDKLDDKHLIKKLYLEVSNILMANGKTHDKEISGYFISGFNNDTRLDMYYCGHTKKEMLGYKHVELTPYGTISDIKMNSSHFKVVIFKNKSDAEKIKKEISEIDNYSHIDFKVKKITLSTWYGV